MENNSLNLPVRSPRDDNQLVAKWYHIILLGFLIVYPGVMNGWGRVLVFGFREALIAVFIMGSGFICLDFCMAELTSILPFSGGAYGFIRVTLGPYLGYLVGCLESLHTLTYPVFILNNHATFIVDAIGGDYKIFMPIITFILYFIVVLANSRKKNDFWYIILIGGTSALILILLYFVLSFYNIEEKRLNYYNENDVLFSGGISQFLSLLPNPAVQFRGIELLPLSCNEVKNPRRTVPRNIMIVSISTFLLLIGVLLVGPAQYPGVQELGGETTVGRFAFVNAFNVTSAVASLITVIGAFFSAIVMIFFFSRQLQAMALSGLLPGFLGVSREDISTPYWGLMIGVIIGYILALIKIYAVELILFIFVVIGLIGAYITGLFIFISFIIMRVKFSSLEREFRNPLGIGSAVYGIIVFFIGTIGLIGFQEGRLLIAGIFVLLLGLSSLYYYLVARKNQHFSTDEESIFFVLYVINANKNRKKRIAPTRNQSRLSSPRSDLSKSLSNELRIKSETNLSKNEVDRMFSSISSDSQDEKADAENKIKPFPVSSEAYVSNDSSYVPAAESKNC